MNIDSKRNRRAKLLESRGRFKVEVEWALENSIDSFFKQPIPRYIGANKLLYFNTRRSHNLVLSIIFEQFTKFIDMLPFAAAIDMRNYIIDAISFDLTLTSIIFDVVIPPEKIKEDESDIDEISYPIYETDAIAIIRFLRAVDWPIYDGHSLLIV